MESDIVSKNSYKGVLATKTVSVPPPAPVKKKKPSKYVMIIAIWLTTYLLITNCQILPIVALDFIITLQVMTPKNA